MNRAFVSILLAISPGTMSAPCQAGEIEGAWFLIESARSSAPPKPVDVPYLSREDFPASADGACEWKTFALQYEQKQFVGRDGRVHKVTIGQTTRQLLTELGGNLRDSSEGAYALTSQFANLLGVTQSHELTLRPAVQLPPGVEMKPDAMDQRAEFSDLGSGFRWSAQLPRLSAFVFHDPLPASRDQLQGSDRVRGAIPPLILLHGSSDPECAARLDNLANGLDSRGIDFQVRRLEF